MELTSFCFWGDDGILFLKAKENVTVFQYYKAAVGVSVDPQTVGR